MNFDARVGEGLVGKRELGLRLVRKSTRLEGFVGVVIFDCWTHLWTRSQTVERP